MTNHFKNWVLWTLIATILAACLNFVFFYSLPDFAVALTLVESMFWAVMMIPVSWNYTRLFDAPRGEPLT